MAIRWEPYRNSTNRAWVIEVDTDAMGTLNGHCYKSALAKHGVQNLGIAKRKPSDWLFILDAGVPNTNALHKARSVVKACGGNSEAVLSCMPPDALHLAQWGHNILAWQHRAALVEATRKAEEALQPFQDDVAEAAEDIKTFAGLLRNNGHSDEQVAFWQHKLDAANLDLEQSTLAATVVAKEIKEYDELVRNGAALDMCQLAMYDDALGRRRHHSRVIAAAKDTIEDVTKLLNKEADPLDVHRWQQQLFEAIALHQESCNKLARASTGLASGDMDLNVDAAEFLDDATDTNRPQLLALEALKTEMKKAIHDRPEAESETKQVFNARQRELHDSLERDLRNERDRIAEAAPSYVAALQDAPDVHEPINFKAPTLVAWLNEAPEALTIYTKGGKAMSIERRAALLKLCCPLVDIFACAFFYRLMQEHNHFGENPKAVAASFMTTFGLLKPAFKMDAHAKHIVEAILQGDVPRRCFRCKAYAETLPYCSEACATGQCPSCEGPLSVVLGEALMHVGRVPENRARDVQIASLKYDIGLKDVNVDWTEYRKLLCCKGAQIGLIDASVCLDCIAKRARYGDALALAKCTKGHHDVWNEKRMQLERLAAQPDVPVPRARYLRCQRCEASGQPAFKRQRLD